MSQILELRAPSEMVKRTPEIMGEVRQKWSAKSQNGTELQLALMEWLRITLHIYRSSRNQGLL